MPKAKILPSATFARTEPPEIKPSPWYMGLDQSSTDNGIACYNSETNTIYTTNFMCGRNGVKLLERLYRLKGFLEKVITDLNPGCVYTEETHPGHRHAYAILMKVEITIHSLLYEHFIPFKSISPNIKDRGSWPAQLGIKGTKEHIRLALVNKVDPISTEHELDAVGIVLGGLIRDKLFKLESMNKLKIIRTHDCNEYLSTIHST